MNPAGKQLWIGTSEAVRHVWQQIRQVAGTHAPVLIHGESGVGKRRVAELIHRESTRSAQPFITLRCDKTPPDLLEHELFGRARGAVPDARNARKGWLETARGGTVFFDEISALAASTQIKLLRLLQERAFERIGGTALLKADVRVIAATNRDLEELIRAEKFRGDLHYRLHVFPIFVPPLRERKTDIPLLAEHFVRKYARQMNRAIRHISTPAIEMLMAYHWPGNVRELEDCIERAIPLSRDGVILCHHLPPTVQMAEGSGTVHTGHLISVLQALEKELIVDMLKATRGNRAAAARQLGLTERIMGLRVTKYGIEPGRFRTKPTVHPAQT